MLKTLPDESVHMCVTSPPYWGLRDYGVEGQLGLEKTPEEYVGKMVEVFREVRRVLRNDGTAWVNMGDAYAGAHPGKKTVQEGGDGVYTRRANRHLSGETDPRKILSNGTGLKPKDLCGIPWRLAFALQADGWYLRSDIIWSKPNPMPESVTDRPTKAHEYLFLLAKSEKYYYDADAIREPNTEGTLLRLASGPVQAKRDQPKNIVRNDGGGEYVNPNGRNRRTVWTIPTESFPESHFATFPQDLVKPCIMAGTSERGACAECGAPWERILEMINLPQRTPAGWDTGPGAHGKEKRGRYSGKWSNEDPNSSGTRILANVKAKRDAGADHNNPFPGRKTAGWKPTCKCGIQETVPCTVLDHFGGSGTSGKVALELGRRAILIELNPTYVEIIRRRCTTTMGLELAG